MDGDFLDIQIGQGIPDLSWKNSFDVPVILDDAGLNPYEFRIWCHLARRSFNKSRKAWPSVRTMSADLGISAAAIHRSIRILQDKNLLKITHRNLPNGGSLSNIYTVLPPLSVRQTPLSHGETPSVCGDTPPLSVRDTKIYKDEDLHLKKESEPKKEAPSSHARNGLSFIAPQVEEVREYFASLGVNGTQAEAFCDFHQSKGWVMSRGVKMKDWRAACRTWKRNMRPTQPKPKRPVI